jgi:hypothetical protein
MSAMTRLPSRNWEVPGLSVLAALSVLFVARLALAEPFVDRTAPTGPFAVGKSFTFECQIRWPEGDGPWLVQAAEFEEPSWAAMEASKWTAYTENGEHVLVQTFSMEPLEAGGHEIPAIEFSYRPDQAFQPAETQVPQSPNAPTLDALRVPPFPVEVLPHTTPNWVSAGPPLLLFALVVGALAWYVVRKRKGQRGEAPGAGTDPPAIDWLADVQQRRLNGDVYGFYVRLTGVAEDPDLRDQFQRTADAVGFKGEQISPDQMDQDLRALQRSQRQLEGRKLS